MPVRGKDLAVAYPTPPDVPARDRPDRSHRAYLTIIVLLLIIVAFLAGGYLLRDGPREIAAAPSSQPSPSSSPPNSRPAESPAPSGSPTDGATHSPSPSGSTASSATAQPSDRAGGANSANVFRKSGPGPITLINGQDIDLDSTEPQWGINTETDVPTTGLDLKFDSGGIHFPTWGSAQLAVMPAGSPLVESTCVEMTGYSRQGISLHDLKVGTAFCVLTSEQRYAIVAVSALALDASYIKISDTTYN